MGFYLLLWAFLTQLLYPSSLGLIDFPSTPYFLYFHYFGSTVAHSHFFTSHTAHGFATSLFPSSFRLVCFLKDHLFILWPYDPLFLPLGFNDFSIQLPTHFHPCCWASPFYWASQNEPSTRPSYKILVKHSVLLFCHSCSTKSLPTLYIPSLPTYCKECFSERKL